MNASSRKRTPSRWNYWGESAAPCLVSLEGRTLLTASPLAKASATVPLAAPPNVEGTWDVTVTTDTNQQLTGKAEISQSEGGKVKTLVTPDGFPFPFKLKGKFEPNSPHVKGKGKIQDPGSGKIIKFEISLTATDNNHINGNFIIQKGENTPRIWSITGTRHQ